MAQASAATDTNGVAPSSGTVGELLDRWFENASADFSPKTALETTGFVNRYLRPGLAFDPRTAEVLAAHYTRVSERAAQCGTTLASDAYVFSHEPNGS